MVKSINALFGFRNYVNSFKIQETCGKISTFNNYFTTNYYQTPYSDTVYKITTSKTFGPLTTSIEYPILIDSKAAEILHMVIIMIILILRYETTLTAKKDHTINFFSVTLY
ncbi:hypothetical protein H8356DRAFT_1431024 [Neocallimastix lanati (nom. inval.)]|nr:hypothetical protein H8356DRAFT_1431024 [Neocallimastix sp. JGI-2020a]